MPLMENASAQNPWGDFLDASPEFASEDAPKVNGRFESPFESISMRLGFNQSKSTQTFPFLWEATVLSMKFMPLTPSSIVGNSPSLYASPRMAFAAPR